MKMTEAELSGIEQTVNNIQKEWEEDTIQWTPGRAQQEKRELADSLDPVLEILSLALMEVSTVGAFERLTSGAVVSFSITDDTGNDVYTVDAQDYDGIDPDRLHDLVEKVKRLQRQLRRR